MIFLKIAICPSVRQPGKPDTALPILTVVATLSPLSPYPD